MGVAALTTVSAIANERFCGRYLNHITNTADNASVCSRIYPFRIGVNFDDTERCTNVAMTQLCEADTAPGGIIGFSLNYVQASCQIVTHLASDHHKPNNVLISS